MTSLERVTQFLRARRVQAYLVGGSVRDEILSRPGPRDLDLSIAGDASRIARAFADAEHGAFYLMDAEHNVARVILDSVYVDFAALRGSLQDDLSTRDFTINAMARSIDSTQIVDPFGGLQDLTARHVRALSSSVFEHDPVRLLRAIRIAGQLGFQVEPQTLSWMEGAGHLLARASMERARDELFKILALDTATTLLRQLDNLGILPHLLPEVTALKGVIQSAPHAYDAFDHSLHTVSELIKIQGSAYSDVANGNYVEEIQNHFADLISADRSRGLVLRLTALLHDIGKASTRSVGEDGRVHFIGHEDQGAQLAESIARRLRMSRDEIDIVTNGIREHLRPPQLARSAELSARAIYRFFRATGSNGVDVCVLSLADTRAKDTSGTNRDTDQDLRTVITTLLDRYYGSPELAIAPPPIIDGRGLMAELHLLPGPEIGRLLEAIREAQVAGKVRTRDEALAYARRVMVQTEKDAEP